MKETLRDLAVVLLVAGTVFFTQLGATRLWDRDEPRNAGCAAEMLAANDWVTPVFNGELRTHKPVLTYWFMMISYALLGVNEFAARLPSALFGTGTCLCAWFIGRRLFGPSAGVWSAVVLATTMMFGVASRAATPDAPLIFFSTLAMAIYVAGVTPRAGAGRPGIVRDYPQHWRTVACMFACMGVAVLAKGPIGLVLPTAVIGMFLLIRRLPEWNGVPKRPWLTAAIRLVRPFAPLHFLKTCWMMRPVTAVLVAAAVALPWYIWVHLRTDGEWTYGFFLTHNFGRAMQSMEGHRGGVWFYPAMLLVGFFPWSIFWLPVAIDSIRTARKPSPISGSMLFALCWAGVYVGLFSLAKTKLPSYITPCYPGAALLTGAFIDRWSRRELVLTRIWPRLAFGSLIAVGVITATAVPIAAQLILPGEELLGVVGLLPILGGSVALLLVERDQLRWSARTMAGTAALFATLLFGVLADRVDEHRHLEDLVEATYASDDVADVDVASLSSMEASWVYYLRKPVPVIADGEDARKFLESADPQGRRRVLVTTRRRVERAEQEPMLEEFAVSRVPYFMENDDEILILRAGHAERTAADDADTIIR